MVATEQGIWVRRGDIDVAWLEHAGRVGQVGCDIETTGLDWRSDQIRTFQLAAGDSIAIVQVEPGQVPTRLASLLSDASILKVFHHAPFDLRFLASRWNAAAAAVACTKVAAKIVEPGLSPELYSLKPTLLRHLGISIDKSQQVSNWSADQLTKAQRDYAANDVRYLVTLLDVLRTLAAQRGDGALLDASFAYLPVRAELDTRRIGDVFDY